MERYIGVDIGGTEIKGLVVDEAGEAWGEAKRATDALKGRDHILGSLEALLRELLDREPNARAIGIASAGRINAETGDVAYATANLPGWQGVRLARRVTAAFGLPAFADNDANAALLGEAWLGAGTGHRNLAMLTLGTGVGGAYMAEGRLIRGSRWSAGEFGHFVLVPGGRPCNCGKRGCAEQYISGTALLRLGEETTGRVYRHGAELIMDAARGIPGARRSLERFIADLAIMLGNIATSLDPEKIIVGGGVIHSRELWWPLLLDRLQAEGLEELPAAAELGNRAGCFGAAKLAMDGFRQLPACEMEPEGRGE